MKKCLICTVLLLLSLLAWSFHVQPVFDVHLHYKVSDAEAFTSSEILATLNEQGVSRAVVIGEPPELATRLYREAPHRIVPFLSVYHRIDDKSRWSGDQSIPKRVERYLQQGHWQGIGELHLFAEDRHSPVFKRLVELAGEYKLVMMIHGDPAVIDTLYDYAPHQPVIWAHAGVYPYPPLLDDYLRRYPALYVDLSVRNARIAPAGQLAEEWYQLFLKYPDRILLGVDTFSTQRWRKFGQVMTSTRVWLEQLPGDVAKGLAYDNANRLFERHSAGEGLK